MIKEKRNKVVTYSLAFLIPIIILLCGYYFTGIFPFGDKSILYRDLKGQYVSYFSQLRNGILGNGSLLYSFDKGLGGNMIGIISYYLMSPFNLLILFAPLKNLMDVILVITVLKIGTCGFTFMYFLNYKFKKIKKSSLIFTTAYALMGFNIIYQSNIMWLDAVYLVPLVIVGIEKIIEGESKKFYVITLALAIITEFYTGFMVCIFSVLYYLYRMFIKMYSEKLKKKFFVKTSIKFIVCSIISGLLSLFIILPTIFQLQGGKSKFAFFTTPLGVNFKLGTLVSKLFINNIQDKNILGGLPSIYVGVLTLFFIGIYFLSKNVKIHKKIATIVMFAVFIVSFYINKLDYIWQGFNAPTGFNFRYTFLFGFFAIYIGYIGYKNIKEISRPKIIIIFVVISAMLLSFYNKNMSLFANHAMKINMSFIAIYTICILLISYGKKEKIVVAIMAIIFFVELGINGFLTFSNLPYAPRKVVRYYQQTVGGVTNYIQKEDPSFYRLDKNFSFTINDTMLLNYRGISEFSSMYKDSLRNFINGFGFINNGYWMFYGDGSTITANSLLNLKYLISKEKTNIPGYQYIYSKNNLNIYENKYYLNAGFMVNKDILNLEFKANDNPFETQDRVLNAMIGNNFEKCYYPINDYSVKLENLKEISTNSQNTVYKKIDGNKGAYCEISFIAPIDAPIYYFSQDASTITANGKRVGGYSIYNYKTLNLGQFKKGQEVKIKINAERENFTLGKNALNYINLNNYEKDYQKIKAEQLNITKFTNRTITANIDVKTDNGVLYTTIPYDSGWKLYVNGKSYKYEKVLGAMIGIKLPKGSYNLELKFVPKGLVLGMGISSIVGLACIIYAIKKKKR
ncbi:MAG: YfhO family protein [Clostridium sp.]|uniref:YfhO family protein n=1 Tax=Clostridium sp. TaxID=1506 RepID=UPI003F35F5BD